MSADIDHAAHAAAVIRELRKALTKEHMLMLGDAIVLTELALTDAGRCAATMLVLEALGLPPGLLEALKEARRTGSVAHTPSSLRSH
jgi:hypothetical protein